MFAVNELMYVCMRVRVCSCQCVCFVYLMGACLIIRPCGVCQPAQAQRHLANTAFVRQSDRRCGRCGDRRGVAVRAGSFPHDVPHVLCHRSSRMRSRAEGAAQWIRVLRIWMRTAFSSDVCGYFRIA